MSAKKKTMNLAVVRYRCLVCGLKLECHRAERVAAYCITYGEAFVCDACGRAAIKALLACNTHAPKDSVLAVARHFRAEPDERR